MRIDQQQSALSIVVCAFNALDYTKLLFASIRKHSRFEHELIVYSDGSSDGTAAWLREQPDVRWMHDRTNRGICTAMNRAAKMATRRFLFFPNTDHVLAPGWDEALLRHLDDRTVVSCQCIEPGTVPVASIFHARNCGTKWDEFDERRFLEAVREVAIPKTVPGINYPFAISKKLWQEVDGLDERFNPGPANDPDLFYRLAFAGARMVRAEDALVYHFSGKSSRMADEARSERREWHEVTERNEARFLEKWGERYRYANGGLPDPGPEACKLGAPVKVEVREPIRVAMDVRPLTPQPQGIGTYVGNLLAAFAKRPGEIEVRCVSDRPEEHAGLRAANVSVGRDPGESRVFHGPAFALPAGLAIPSVVTIHDLAFLAHPEWYPAGFVRHLASEVERSAASAAALIVPSDAVAGDVARRLGVLKSRIRRIYEGSPVTGAVDEPELIRARERYASGNEFILSVGVQQWRKNALTLVRAFARLKRAGRIGHRLVLVGGASCEDPLLRQEAEAMGADVTLTPYLPERELRALYQSASLFAYPSLDEGFGLPLLEAMQAGIPVVASDRGGIPEVAGDGALLVPPDDVERLSEAISSVVSDRALKEDLVTRGRKRAAQFSWERAAADTIEVYREAATCKPVRVAAQEKSRPRIAIDARFLGRVQTGTGRYTTEIVPALLRHVRNADFVLIGPESLDRSLLPGGSDVLHHEPVGVGTLGDPAWEQFSLPAHLAGCDLLFSPTGVVPVTSSTRRVPVLHDLGFEDRPDHYEARLRDYLGRWVRNSCLAADRIVAVSEFTRDRIVRLYGIDAGRIAVVHHGGPGQLRVPGEKQHLLCVSSFEPNKNLVVLVEAFERSLAKKTKLILAGRQGRALPEVLETVRRLRLESAVEIRTDPSDQEMDRLYGEAALFAYPSLYEGFGLPLVEAMARGVPILANNLASMPEVLGGVGHLVDDPSVDSWSRALRGLWDDVALREGLAEKSFARAAEFNWEKAASRTWSVLSSALEAR